MKWIVDFKFSIFIIKFREKCSEQNMKKIFREIVFVCEDFYLNCKENELHRKYKIFGGLRKMKWIVLILEIEKNG